MTRTMYLRDCNKNPVGCIAVRINAANQCVEYGLSVLNPVDKFDRKVARQLAKGRLEEHPEVVRVSKHPSIHDVTLAVMNDLVLYQKTPGRAQKAAKLWLRGLQFKLDKKEELW